MRKCIWAVNFAYGSQIIFAIIVYKSDQYSDLPFQSQFAHVKRIIDEHAQRLPKHTKEQPKRQVAQLTIFDIENMVHFFLKDDRRGLHEHSQKCIIRDQSERDAHDVLMTDSAQ